MLKKTFFAAVSMLAIASSACVVETRTTPIDITGDVIVDWTISGAKAPSLCTQSSARTLVIDVFNNSGTTVGSYEQRCEAFATTITLNDGLYSATATLLDGGGVARTTTVSLGQLDIIAGTSITVPIDFPSSSFF